MNFKIYISQPMKGLSDTEIQKTRKIIIEYCKEHYQATDENFIDTIISEEPEENLLNKPIWYLGKAIQKMANATVLVMPKGCDKTNRGCYIEKAIARKYNIPVIEIYKEDLDNTKIDNLTEFIVRVNNCYGFYNALLEKTKKVNNPQRYYLGSILRQLEISLRGLNNLQSSNSSYNVSDITDILVNNIKILENYKKVLADYNISADFNEFSETQMKSLEEIIDKLYKELNGGQNE